jgi:hypothetical protein
MAVPMPATLVLFVCRVVLGEPDANSGFTNWRPSEWDMKDGVMHCRRLEVPLYDSAVDQGAAEQPFTPWACMQAAAKMGPGFDVEHKDKPWRFWRAACPTKIINDKGEVVGWQIPACPESYGTVICETDSAI